MKSIITELNYKMTQIGNVFSQPLHKDTFVKLSHHNHQDNSPKQLQSDLDTVTIPHEDSTVNAVKTSGDNNTEIAPAAIITRAIRNRRLIKRPVYLTGNSDFTDTDENDQETDKQLA